MSEQGRRRRRLIIADDDPVVRTLLSMSLADDFDVVGVAADAVEAVELAREAQPDVALVDVEMPLGGGAHAVRGIREVAPGAAIVVLSGDESDGVVRDLISAGAVSYQRKGVPAPELVDALRSSIAAHTVELG